MSYTILCRAHWNSCHSNSWYTCNNFCTAAASELETAHLTQCWNYMPVTLWGIAMCLKLSSSKLQFCSPCPWHIFNSLLKLFFFKYNSQHDKWAMCLLFFLSPTNTSCNLSAIHAHLFKHRHWESLLKKCTASPRNCHPTPPTSSFSPGAGYL